MVYVALGIWRRRRAARSASSSNTRPCLTSTRYTGLHSACRATRTTLATQETLLRAYRYFRQYTPGTNCRAWLLTILYNNFRNGYRGAGREQLSATPEDFERELEKFSSRGDQALSNPEMLVSEQIPDHEVSAALDALPPDFRAVLMLVDVQELNYKEVAQVIGIPIGTVKSRVSRGRQMMRTALGAFARRRGLVR